MTEKLGDSGRIVLQPLGPSHILELLASLGQLPDEGWRHALAPLLHEVTGGSPLLVLETLQPALDRDLLRLAAGHWSCPFPDGPQAHLRAGSARPLRLAPRERSTIAREREEMK